MGALAVPGVVIGIGYLRTYYGVQLPSGQPLATFWFMIVIALAVRRLPYALRACTPGLQQVSPQLEEAAENLGATKARTVRRILCLSWPGACWRASSPPSPRPRSSSPPR